MTTNDGAVSPQDTSQPTWAAREVLWQIGADLVRASVSEYDDALLTVMATVGSLTGASTAGVWDLNHKTDSLTRRLHWSADGTTTLQRGDPLRKAVELFDLTAERHTFLEDVGLEARQLISIGKIDDFEHTFSALAFAGMPRTLSDEARELIRGITPIVRQFCVRIRAERSLENNLRVDTLLVRFATQLQAADRPAMELTLANFLPNIHDALDTACVALLDPTSDGRVDLRFTAPGDGAPTRLAASTSFLAAAKGFPTSITAADLASETSIVSFSSLFPTPLPTDLRAMIAGSDDSRVALVPVPESGRAGALIVAVRRPGAHWSAPEVAVLTAVGSLLSQARARIAAEELLSARLAGQQLLANICQRFVMTSPSEVEREVDTAIVQVSNYLGTQAPALLSMVDGGLPRVRQLVDCDNPDAGFTEAVLKPALSPTVRRLLAGQARRFSFEPPTSMGEAVGNRLPGSQVAIIAPLRSASSGRHSLIFSRPNIGSGPDADVLDVVVKLAELIAQLWTRTSLERSAIRSAEVALTLTDIAEEFMGVNEQDFAATLGRSCAQFGHVLGLSGLIASDGSHRADRSGTERSPVPVVWTPHPPRLANPEPGVTKERLTWTERHVQQDTPLSTTISIATLIEPDTIEVGALATLTNLVAQTRARLLAEAEQARRHDIQLLVSDCAAILAEATAHTLTAVVHKVLASAGEWFGADRMTIWTSHADDETYRVIHRWERPGLSIPSADVKYWGRTPNMDQLRIRSAEVDNPAHFHGATRTELGARNAFAVARGTGNRVDGFIAVLSPEGVTWPTDAGDTLRTLSRMIGQVEARIKVEGYANAAFSRSPVGLVLRDKDSRIVSYNSSFGRFLGLDSLETLIGSVPDDLRSQPSAAATDHSATFDLTTEVAFVTADGTDVWANVQRSRVDGQLGEDMWLETVEDITQRRIAEQLLVFQANHDELTGLANRRHLAEEMKRSAEAGSMAVLILDLDRFKDVNDSLGHDRGDEMLVIIAGRIQAAVGPNETVARLGGDEFAVLTTGVNSHDAAESLATKLLAVVGEPVTLGAQSVYPSTSIGIAFAARHAAAADTLRRADTALYRAKDLGRGRVVVFDETLATEAIARFATEAGLRSALVNDDLRVHYQPKVSLPEGRVLGAEALVRWHHPVQGLLDAERFVNVAEDAGLIVQIGELVLAHACAEAATWPGGDNGPTIAVNLAAAQVQREETLMTVETALAESGLAPHRLCLEITESAVMADIARSDIVLARLKDMGVCLALDDFGTGFSSLAYLKRFPVDELKIDRTFVSELGHGNDGRAFVRSIISLAQSLGLDVVAEGVETNAQAEVVYELGCRKAQGFLFGEPAPSAAFADLLR